MFIREATSDDRHSIHDVHSAAFPESERGLVANLAVDLLTAEGALSLVAEEQGRVVGHVAFSPVEIEGQPKISAFILAPLGIRPESQKHGVGSSLVKDGIERLSASGVDVLFVYGDPAYYGRFGFTAEAAERFVPPHELEYPFGWQALLLDDRCAAGPTASIRCVDALSDPSLW